MELKERVFSGVQPTGNLHLGNYLGAIRNFARLQSDYECLYCVVDMHAITVWQEPKDVIPQTREIAAAFLAAGASYVAVDCDREALDPLPNPNACAVLASGTALPIATASMDVAISSNVFEHVRNPVRLCDELARVVRPGGLVVISYTNWFSPWGGHETSPFHYLGGKRAIRLYTRRYGHPPKNQVGDNLFRVSVAQGLGWARSTPGIDLVEARPRYYPGWLAWLVRVPGLREVVTWNVWMVLRKR